MATLKGKGSTGGRCRHSLTCLPTRPACAPDANRQPRTSGREPLGELSVTERCNRLALLVTSPLILADRCEECPRLLGKSHRLILLPDDPAWAFNHKQLPSSWRSGSKKLDGRDEKGGGEERGVSTLCIYWGTWTNPDSEVSRQSSAGQVATICNLRSESGGWRAVASCYLTPPALASRVSPLLCWNVSIGSPARLRLVQKNYLDNSCFLLTSCKFL